MSTTDYVKKPRPCRKCGVVFDTQRCKACAAAAAAARWAKDPAAAAERCRLWREANPDAYRASILKHRQNNAEKLAQATAKWRRENPDKLKEQKRNWHHKNAERINSIRRERYAAHPTAVMEANRRSYFKNWDKHQAAAKAWSTANPEKARVAKRKWYQANKAVYSIYGQNRRARLKVVGGVLSRGLRLKLYKLQKGKCACCALPLGRRYHLDHITPLALGGTNTDANIQLLRSLCNWRKGSKDPIAFMQQQGKLL
jgi:hypothetical protein